MLFRSRGVAKSEEHDGWFEGSAMTYKSGLPFISFFDMDIVVSPPEIDLREVPRSLELVNELRDERERVVVPNRMFVQIPIILYHLFPTVLLWYKEYGGGLFGFGWADIPFGELFVDELRDFLLFFHRKGNQSSFLRFERVFEIDSMVPWLSEREPTGGFFREDVEIGMVTFRYELLRGAYGFLGRRGLNLSLMDIFQSFSFFVFEGGESFRPMMSVEHETRSWAPGELNHA